MRHDARQFEPRPELVRAVRAFVADAARSADVDDNAASLAASELATNVVRHVGTPFTVRTFVAAGYLRVEFVDGSSVLPTVRDLAEDADNGRGVYLVEASTTAWGVESYPSGGKGIWFELGAPCGASKALSPSS
ncbi:MAG TPA: ATP-binding protein [Acidimicrobiia bacterium]|nr:ATP-binding protein [Acidimicrobiia bacterium]